MTPIGGSAIPCPSSSVTATVYGCGSPIEATRPNGMCMVAAPAGWMSRAPSVTVASAAPDSTSLPPGAMILYCMTGNPAGVPHSPQNFAPLSAVPQLAQNFFADSAAARVWPQLAQNFPPPLLSPQFGHAPVP